MKVLTDNKYYHQIADVIREQNGTNNTYTPPQMVSALKDLFYEEAEGVPPITYNGIGENLLDYRIDGASGGVGDRTKNLVDINSTTNKLINASLIEQDNNDYRLSDYIAIPNEGLNISGFTNLQSGDAIRFILYDVNKNIIERLFKTDTIVNIDNTQGSYLRINYNINNWDMSNLIVVLGSTTPENYEPYGYKVPVVISGKNLLNNVLTSRTLNGVTITVNQDKSINISGQLDVSYKDFYVSGQWNSDVPLFEEGTYKLIVESTNNNIPITCGFNGSYATGITGTGNRVFTKQISSIMFRLTDSMTLNNETLKIMVCKPIIEDTSYEPYHETTTTNIYLDEPILENESISLSDTNTNIPTIRGTNVLTVDTTVQPSNVYVKARKESQYETIMRERYEEAQAQLDALESE